MIIFYFLILFLFSVFAGGIATRFLQIYGVVPETEIAIIVWAVITIFFSYGYYSTEIYFYKKSKNKKNDIN